MKILHSADLHLDSPFSGQDRSNARFLRQALLEVPGKLASVCRQECCDLVLLSGDLFDGPWTGESLDALRQALAEMAVPVFISPGNHDFCSGNSPYLTETFPENVHIFTKPVMESVSLSDLSCRVWGAGFTSMDAPALLEGFHAQGQERYQVGILHGDPSSPSSPCCPVTAAQVENSGLDYLALGHIHRGSSFRAGSTLCAWPGCPMGRGWDETGVKGVLIVTLEQDCQTRFLPLDTPRFFTPEASPDSLSQVLPPALSEDFYRVTLTGEAEPVDLAACLNAYPHLPHLTILDRTTPPADLWEGAGDDTLSGVTLRILRDQMEGADAQTRDTIRLSARILRQLLSGQEVTLP